jgi:hypothetical protein
MSSCRARPLCTVALLALAALLSGCASYASACWTAPVRNQCGYAVPDMRPVQVSEACRRAADEVLRYCP